MPTSLKVTRDVVPRLRLWSPGTRPPDWRPIGGLSWAAFQRSLHPCGSFGMSWRW